VAAPAGDIEQTSRNAGRHHPASGSSACQPQAGYPVILDSSRLYRDGNDSLFLLYVISYTHVVFCSSIGIFLTEKRYGFYPMVKIRILVIEDNRMLRDGITDMLNEQKDMHVVATIGNSNNILMKAIQTKPHVALIDVGVTKFKESSIVELLKDKMPEIKVIGMGFVPSQSDIVEFVEAGASGFILKDATMKEFFGTIRSVALGEKILPPSMASSIFSHLIEHALKKGGGKIVSAVRMTKREREIIALIADGMSNKEIAQQLNIAVHTVKSHVHNIMEKLALHSRLQIAKFTNEENR
jgi:DNA-binding NarL/FixJ family response regulator